MATTEAATMLGTPAGAWLALGGLLLLPAASASLFAQEPTAQALIERLRQIQGELAAEAPASEVPAPDAAAQAPAPEMPEAEIRALVRQSLGVEILAVEVVEHDGRPAYAITVMTPPGDRNDAYRIATLLFDGATGGLLGQESPAPRTQAPDLPSATAPGDFEPGGPEIRRRSVR